VTLVSSVWIRPPHRTKDGRVRYRVEFRAGGREAPIRYGGVFNTKREANARKEWLRGELAAMRLPDLRLLAATKPAPTLADAARAWRQSRVDIPEQTQNGHDTAFGRIFKARPKLRTRRVDHLTVKDVIDLVAALHAHGFKRETIRKSKTALALTLDFHDVTPNVARDGRVKLPKERRPHIPPPLAEHVETVVGLVAREYVLPILIIDWAGPRVSEIETAEVGDVDETRRAIRVRPTFEKNERYRHLELPDDLFSALLATLPPREDRDRHAPLFPGLTDANLRMAISRACKAGGVPHFSPHGLRRRRGSLHYQRTGSLAQVAELLGDSKRVAEDHYVYALTDFREIDPHPALARLFA
jgi:integrase